MPSETGHKRRSSFPRAYLSSNSISRTPAARLEGTLSCQLLTHARQQTASYSITRPLYRPVAKRDGVRRLPSQRATKGRKSRPFGVYRKVLADRVAAKSFSKYEIVKGIACPGLHRQRRCDIIAR